MKKFLVILLSLLMGVSLFSACTKTPSEGNKKPGNESSTEDPEGDPEGGPEEEPEEEPEDYWLDSYDSSVKMNLSASGYAKDNIGDFSQYVGTDAYRTVSTADELIEALLDAKYHYDNVWDEATQSYTQVPQDGYTEDNWEGTVHVIEIVNDLNLGYKKMSSKALASGIVDNYASKYESLKDYLCWSDMFLENGISQIKVEGTSNLLVYSKNGAKITHAGFKLNSDDNVVFRNLEFDEMWQWEDAPTDQSTKIGDYDWFGWAYFKISFCGFVWIDHCTFGKSYDGQIDYSNPVYDANAGLVNPPVNRPPFGANGDNGLHISWCKFNSGSDDEDGYIYKMMEKIEQEYKEGKQNYLYYNSLRNAGASFDDILYGLAIPQKKGFLCGDGTNKEKPDYEYNKNLHISFSNCYFKNLEDRIPKLRGGNAVLYNCVVDSLQYMTYRTKLKSLNAANVVASGGGKRNTWKCGLVSQGFVCGCDGSIYAENCIFRGIDTLLKNNDGVGTGGFKMVNCIYQKNASTTEVKGSTTNATNPFPNANGMTTQAFAWHTEDGEQPFDITTVDLDDLEEELENSVYGSGTRELDEKFLLRNDYTK